MASEDLRLINKLLAVIEKQPTASHLEDLFEMLRIYEEEDFKHAHELNKRLRAYTDDGLVNPHLPLEENIKHFELKKRSLLFDAEHDFDAYLQYIEWNREPEKKFYMPRRSVLKVLVDDMQDLEDGRLDYLSVSLPPRVGKLLADDTLVLTTKGWKNHGDLKVGDKVFNHKGETVRVIAVHPKHYTTHTVTVSDGSQFEVHENHEWLVYNRRRHKEEVLSTKYMLEDGLISSNKNGTFRYIYQIPHKEPIEGKTGVLHVDPYVFGAWLGDGTTTNPYLTVPFRDKNIIDEVVTRGYEISSKWVHKQTGVPTYSFVGLRQDLQKYGLCKSRTSVEKYIPVEYLLGSKQQRLELLAGLLDTDGSFIKKENRYQFSTSSPQILEGVIRLVSTFGWRVSVTDYPPTLSSSGIQGKKTVWKLGFNPTCEIPCKVPRKRNYNFSKRVRQAIINIEESSPKQGNCITVEGGVYLVGERLIPTHNSTLGCFFMTWLMGRYPYDSNIMSAHSEKLTKGFYKETLSIITDPQYLWADVFPTATVANTSAEDLSVDINEAGTRYPTLTCRSIGATLTGAVEVTKCLYCDDLIEDLEEALNPRRLQNKYDAYANQLKDRRKENSYELMIGTRWSVADIQGRIYEQYYGDPRYRFRTIPALDKNGDSNFDYPYGVGFSTKHFLDMKASIDDATWSAKYIGDPYVREGLLFPKDELLYYNGVLPDVEPDRIMAVVDIAWGGGDSVSMPIAYIYGERCYIHDVVFNDGDKTITQPAVAGKIIQHRPHIVVGEANAGGHEYMDSVDKLLRAEGIRLNLTSKQTPSTQAKISRIIQMSPEIKEFYYIDEKNASKEYRAFMNELTTFVVQGKNPNDDAPDSLAMLVNELVHGNVRLEVFKRPF